MGLFLRHPHILLWTKNTSDNGSAFSLSRTYGGLDRHLLVNDPYVYIYIYIYVHISTVQRKNGQHEFCQQLTIMSCNYKFLSLSNHAVVFFRHLYPLICQGDEHPSEPDDSMSVTQERTQLGIFMMPFLVSNLQFFLVFLLSGRGIVVDILQLYFSSDFVVNSSTWPWWEI